MLTKAQQILLQQAEAIELETAREAGAIGYMARAMVQATMPHRDPGINEFERVNGCYTLRMLAPSKVGLPYGTIPRLLLAWISTEAVRTQDRTLVLGNTLSAFMQELGLVPTGGRWGTITRLRDQMERLFSCSVSCVYSDGSSLNLKNVQIASEARLWWDPKLPHQAGLWESTLELGEKFFQEIIEHPVPMDLRALRALKRSPLALDVYCWLSYRLGYLKGSTIIPWPLLVAQFGSHYARERAFREAFSDAVRKVLIVYPAAKVLVLEQGLQLKPSPPHIAR